MSRQKEETQSYFSTNAGEWHASAQSQNEKKLNSLKQRYDCVLAEADQIGTVKTFLDLGCGSGEMSILMAERGTRCKGIDFAEEMIEIATRTANENNVGDLCTFETGSVLEIDLANEPYDMVAALGLIEYLSIEDTKNLFKRVNDCLKDKGA